MILTYGQPKYRLFLLCEGNGDGTGVHFLDCSKHKGYVLENKAAEDFMKESVELLRFVLQVKSIKRFKETQKSISSENYLSSRQRVSNDILHKADKANCL